jgi:hypothetical protein
MQPKHILLVVAGTLIAFALGLGFGLGVGSGLGNGGAAAPKAPKASGTAAPKAGRLLCSANPCRVTMTNNGSAGLVVQDAPGPRARPGRRHSGSADR